MSVKVFYATRPRQLSEVLKVELHPDYCRESGTAKAGQAFDLGQPLGQITTTGADKGKLVAFDPDGTNGSQTIVGVSHVPVEAGADDVECVVYSARGSVLALNGLRWPDGISDAEIAAALAALKALGLIVRPF